VKNGGKGLCRAWGRSLWRREKTTIEKTGKSFRGRNGESAEKMGKGSVPGSIGREIRSGAKTTAKKDCLQWSGFVKRKCLEKGHTILVLRLDQTCIAIGGEKMGDPVPMAGTYDWYP